MNQIGNDNHELNHKPTIQEVDNLAAELCRQFNNHGYFRWYCSAIWKLGIPRVQEIKGRVSDAKMPGHLFTKFLREDLKRYEADQKLREMFDDKKD